MGVSGKCQVLAAVPPGMIQYPLYRRLGGPKNQSGWGQKNLTLTGIQFPGHPTHSMLLYQTKYCICDTKYTGVY